MLKADCANCFGLCCVVPAFSVSSEFAIDKPAGQPCPNLQVDSRCGIHAKLRSNGFAGCTVYDCFGAGQQVCQVSFAGNDWRQSPTIARQMFGVFAIMRTLHELLYYLTEALSWPVYASLHVELSDALRATEALTRSEPNSLLDLDVDAHRREINMLLLQASEQVRTDAPSRAVDHRGADLIGADLRGRDLRGASFRGALLVGADLRAADLRLADLIGADLRAADIRRADLCSALFLTPMQVDSAKGDATTRLPPSFVRPEHW